MARMLYFAVVREKMGRGEEEISLPDHVQTVDALMLFLRELGEPYAATLAGEHLRVAVNQAYAQKEDRVCDSDEIAIFPPVSGG